MNKTFLVKACPLFGNPVRYRDYSPGYSNDRFYISHEVECKDCGFKLVRQSKFKFENGELIFEENGYEKIMNIWNRRA